MRISGGSIRFLEGFGSDAEKTPGSELSLGVGFRVCALTVLFVLGTTGEAGERYRVFGKMISSIVGERSTQGSGDLKR